MAWVLFGGRFKAGARIGRYVGGEERSGKKVGDWGGGAKVVSLPHLQQVPVVGMVLEG